MDTFGLLLFLGCTKTSTSIMNGLNANFSDWPFVVQVTYTLDKCVRYGEGTRDQTVSGRLTRHVNGVLIGFEGEKFLISSAHMFEPCHLPRYQIAPKYDDEGKPNSTVSVLEGQLQILFAIGTGCDESKHNLQISLSREQSVTLPQQFYEFAVLRRMSIPGYDFSLVKLTIDQVGYLTERGARFLEVQRIAQFRENNCWVAGWGFSGANVIPEVLQTAQVRLHSWKKCKNSSPHLDFTSFNSGGQPICFKSKTAATFDEGDCGSPVVCFEGNDRIPYLKGTLNSPGFGNPVSGNRYAAGPNVAKLIEFLSLLTQT